MNALEGAVARHARPQGIPSAVTTIWRHRGLILEMTAREVVGRYRGSILGLAWSFVTPVLMLLAYTFVFGVIFNLRWNVSSAEQSKAEFALILFVGITVHTLMAECLTRAPSLILGSPNLVKRVLFPLEILPVVTMCAALFHAAVSLVVLAFGLLLVMGGIPLSALAVPILLLPFVLAVLGLTWGIAALGVYLRDISQAIGIVMMLLLFLSPIFYPLAAVPADFRIVMQLNPLTYVVEAMRDALVWGAWPTLSSVVWHLSVGCTIGAAGLWCFIKTRNGFADVL